MACSNGVPILPTSARPAIRSPCRATPATTETGKSHILPTLRGVIPCKETVFYRFIKLDNRCRAQGQRAGVHTLPHLVPSPSSLLFVQGQVQQLHALRTAGDRDTQIVLDEFGLFHAGNLVGGCLFTPAGKLPVLRLFTGVSGSGA